ncbi:hypothetical protein [Neobacillus muris]|uniref:hypothetical protein n=1 Tax=Neobacillus muris TaxID=2941334 RepID=UPI00203FD097|nr:hypothetical protein [Neobacillus muris]
MRYSFNRAASLHLAKYKTDLFVFYDIKSQKFLSSEIFLDTGSKAKPIMELISSPLPPFGIISEISQFSL